MRVIFMTNILTPYRVKFFQTLHDQNMLEFKVYVLANTESGRSWDYNYLKKEYTELLNSKTISIMRREIHLSTHLSKKIEEYKPDIIVTAGSYLFPNIWLLLLNRKKLSTKIFFWSESHLYEKRNYNKTLLLIREIIRHIILSKFDGFVYPGELSKIFINKYRNKKSKLVEKIA